MTPDIYEARRV